LSLSLSGLFTLVHERLLLHVCLILSFYTCKVVLRLFDGTIVLCFLKIISDCVYIKQMHICHALHVHGQSL